MTDADTGMVPASLPPEEVDDEPDEPVFDDPDGEFPEEPTEEDAGADDDPPGGE